MKVPLAKIEKLVSKDTSRPVLSCLHLRIEDNDGVPAGWLEATDSYALARVPVELEDGDTAGLIPLDALLEARKVKADSIVANKTVKVRGNGRTVEWEREDGMFPNSGKLIPAATETRLVFNAKLLYETAQALGTDVVILSLPPEGKPIRVDAFDNHNDAVGVIMPVSRSR